MTDTTSENAPPTAQEAVLYTLDPSGRQPLTVHQLERLHADLHRSRVATRDQGGRTLSYLEAYDVRATLIRIWGYGGFSVDVLESEIVHQSTYRGGQNQDRDLWRIAAKATVRLAIHQTGATYTETAAASQSGPDIGEVMDFAIKTATSDALKRCATNLGTQYGLSLYRDGSTQDVVSRVFAPGQMEIVDDLRLARSDAGEAGQAARERMQARLKTHEPADPTVRALQAADAAAAPAEEPVAAQDVPEVPQETPEKPAARPRAPRRAATA